MLCVKQNLDQLFDQAEVAAAASDEWKVILSSIFLDVHSILCF